ncbi:MAG: alpha-beta hydrolase superfamily lysophospholipase [Glaciecola sp.]|jgi:alpha-beta hydrolase superfamily lysophospholipase
MRSVWLAVAGATAAATVGVSRRWLREQRGKRADRLAVMPSHHGLDSETVTLEAVDGTPLHAWFVAAAPGAPVVVLVHGYGSHGGDLLGVAKQLQDGGLATLLLDVRGHGRSPWNQRPSPEVFSEDLGAAIDWAVTHSGGSPVALLGHSMGGSAAIRAAASRSGIGALVTVAAVADPTLTNMGWWPASFNRTMIERVAKRQGADPSRHFARHLIGDVTAPILLVHGEADRLIPIRHGEVLAQAAPDATFVRVAGAGHADLAAFSSAILTVVAFLQAALGAPGAVGLRQ